MQLQRSRVHGLAQGSRVRKRPALAAARADRTDAGAALTDGSGNCRAAAVPAGRTSKGRRRSRERIDAGPRRGPQRVAPGDRQRTRSSEGKGDRSPERAAHCSAFSGRAAVGAGDPGPVAKQAVHRRQHRSTISTLVGRLRATAGPRRPAARPGGDAGIPRASGRPPRTSAASRRPMQA